MPDAVAEVEYKILLEFKPKDLDTRTKLALVLIRLGKLDGAERELEKARRQSPEDYRVLEGYIVLRLKQKRIDEAVSLGLDALKIAPDEAILYLHYGKALEANGESVNAFRTYQTGLRKALDNQNEHDRQQLEEAIKKFKISQSDPASN